MFTPRLLLLCLLLISPGAGFVEGSGSAAAPDSGPVFLVAAEKMSGGNFSETVVLLVRNDKDGAFGLIINRPSNIPVSRLVPDLRISPQSDRPVWQGGPVAPGEMFILLRSVKGPEGMVRIGRDLWIGGDRDLLRKLLRKKKYRGDFRIYSGYAGWAPGQLQGELLRGGWHVVEGSTDKVFSLDPAGLWRRLSPALRAGITRRPSTAPFSPCDIPPEPVLPGPPGRPRPGSSESRLR